MFNASEIGGKYLFKEPTEKGCWLHFGDYAIITSDKRPVGSRESSLILRSTMGCAIIQKQGR